MTGTIGGDCSALLAVRAHVDDLVSRTDEIDEFCSSPDWIVPLHHTLGSGGLLVETTDDAAVVLAVQPGPQGRTVLWGVDVAWGYARPVVGSDLDAGIDLLDRVLRDHRRDVVAVALTGVDPAGAFAARLVERLGHRLIGTGEPVGRRVADLADGVDAYLERRSRAFRRNARQAQRRAAEAGVVFEWVAGGGADVVERAVRAESHSWKGREGSGLADPTFARFYGELAAGLAPTGRLRAGFARLDGHDIGFILGARRGSTYRGLQLAYAESARALSIGNLLQLGQMYRLAGEGVTRYDLGQDMAYKHAWSDELFVTDTLVLRGRVRP